MEENDKLFYVSPTLTQLYLSVEVVKGDSISEKNKDEEEGDGY